jgi:putative transposase
MVLDVLVQSGREKRAAKRLLCKLLKRQCRAPCVMITDKLPSYRVSAGTGPFLLRVMCAER